MVRVFVLIAMVVFSFAAGTNTASAQVAMEYGVIGSKTPPKSADVAGNIENKVEIGSQRTACSSKACRSKRTPQSTTAARVKEPQVVEKRAGQKSTGSGPLIIEQRGDHYERVN